MFYSHEILTSRKYGVATVWLVATLGAKSTTKKVTRKAILEVNVKKACFTIMEPEAPMALRLQSNLLYGVSRVYSQQCGYVLVDAQRAQDALRALLKAVHGNALDVDAGRVRPDQLILEDDPAFIPDMALPALDFDFASLQFDMAEYKDSQQSMLSPHARARSGSSISDHSLLGLDIHSSGVGSYQLPAHDQLQISSAQKAPLGRPFEEEEEQLMLDDFDFEFDGEGKIRDIDEEEVQLRSGSFAPQLGRLTSDSAASGRVLREHEEALAGHAQGQEFDADGDLIMQFDDGLNALPEADPFSPKAAPRRARRNSDLSVSPQVESSSDIAEAQLRAPRKRRAAKRIESDQQIELLASDLSRWNREYLENMKTAKDQKQKKSIATQAKVNAKAWIFGNGIGNIGQGIGRAHLPSPLDIFAGEELMAAITGVTVDSRVPKRRRADDNDDVEDHRNVRARPDIDEDNIGRDLNMEDDLMMNQFDDSNLEVGRDAPAGLEDQLSAMPWNVSISLNSFRAHGPGSIDGRGSSIPGGRPGSRLTSASPFLGRGSALGGLLPDIERLDEGTDDNLPAIDNRGYSSSIGPVGGRGRTLTPSGAGDLVSEKDFEMFGPVAAIDTQTANQSQWVREALAREAMNFFEFVKNTIIEADIDAGEEDIGVNGLEKDLGGGEVSFETLFPPESNTAMVASQAFHHVLTLATKGLLGVQQNEMWGDIAIRTL